MISDRLKPALAAGLVEIIKRMKQKQPQNLFHVMINEITKRDPRYIRFERHDGCWMKNCRCHDGGKITECLLSQLFPFLD